MHAIIWLLAVLMLEMLVGLVLLGTWIAEGRRRAEELERIEGLLRRAGVAAPDLRTGAAPRGES
jgi:hypothetical protein